MHAARSLGAALVALAVTTLSTLRQGYGAYLLVERLGPLATALAQRHQASSLMTCRHEGSSDHRQEDDPTE